MKMLLLFIVAAVAVDYPRDDPTRGPTGPDYSGSTPSSAVNCDYEELYYTTTESVSWGSENDRWSKVRAFFLFFFFFFFFSSNFAQWRASPFSRFSMFFLYNGGRRRRRKS